MPVITLPDGSRRDYDTQTHAGRIAADIGPGLAKSAIGARVNGELVDLNHPIDEDSQVSIVTIAKKSQPPSEDALLLIRHSCAHVMAEAIQRVFPEALLVYGPPTDQGF